MDKIKRIVIILTLLMLIIVSIIIVLLVKNKDNVQEIIDSAEGDEGEQIQYNVTQIEDVQDKEKFFTVENCINTYLDILNINNSSYFTVDENGNEIKIMKDEEINQNIIDILSKKYVSQNNITTKNISQKIETFKEDLLFTPIEMKMIAEEKIENYLVHGILANMDNKYIKDIYVIVNLNKEDRIFSITPINEEHDNIGEIKFEYNDETITQNDNNSYMQQVLTYEEIAKKYFQICKNLLIVKPEIIYDKLEKEYKEVKFKTYEEFEQYLQDRQNEIKTNRLVEYNIDDKSEITTMTLRDQYENMYMINEEYIMKFDLKLDNYTILEGSILDKYNKGNEQAKTGVNIERVLEAINHRDYQFVYNNLNETFRNNNFNDINKFKKYIQTKFYANSDIEYLKYTTEGNSHIFNVNVKDTTNEANVNNLNIIVQLNEGTNFEMAFGI